MNGTQTQYAGILLDASFFVKPFSEQFLRLLRSHPLHRATTYETEEKLFKKRLRDKEQQTYQQNLAALKHFTFTPLGTVETDILSATMGLAELGSRNQTRYLYATSNRLLIQLVVLKKIGIDLYDIVSDKLIRAEDFDEYGKHFRYEWEDPNWIPKDETKCVTAPDPDDLILYNENGDPVSLLDPNRVGGFEANIYKCKDDPNALAKVYKAGQLTDKKIANILRLKDHCTNHTFQRWAMFPKEPLYLQDKTHSNRSLVGFLMSKAQFDVDLVHHPVLDDVWEEVLLRDALSLCRDMVVQLLILSVHGIYVYDFNPSNFAVIERDGKRIELCIMMDTDSFCSEEYHTEVDWSAVESFDKFRPGQTTKRSAIETCLKLAYIFTGFTLVRGYPPQQKDGTFGSWYSGHEGWIPEPLRRLIRLAIPKDATDPPFFDALLYRLEQAIENTPDDLRYVDISPSLPENEEEPDGTAEPEEEPDGTPEPEAPAEPQPEPEPSREKFKEASPPPPPGGKKQQSGKKEPPVEDDEPAYCIPAGSFDPSNRMRDTWSSSLVGLNTAPYVKPTYFFVPAPLRSQYPANYDAQIEREAQRRQRLSGLIKIAGIVMVIVLLICGLFLLNPEWLEAMWNGIEVIIDFAAFLWKSLTDTAPPAQTGSPPQWPYL